MSRDEVIDVIRQTTEELGRVPSMNELITTNRLSRYDLRKHFAVYTSALEACGLQRHGQGYELSMGHTFLIPPFGPGFQKKTRVRENRHLLRKDAAS